MALQRQLEADGEIAAYAEITREFGRPVTFPVLAEVVRDVHDESREPGGQRDAATAEGDLARRVGMLQAAAIQLQGGTTLAGTEQAAASREGLGGPLQDPADLGHRVAEAEAQENKGDTAGKRLELASELAARAVANTISIPQLGSNEIVQIVTGTSAG